MDWDVLYRPKDRGRIDLKRVEEMNKALLAMLAWRVITQGSDTWAKVLRLKYGLTNEGHVCFKQKKRSSRI